jgi:hydrogenase maturation protease
VSPYGSVPGEPRIAPVTVLGVGNPIMGDDGAGPQLLTMLASERHDDRIEYVDGGTGGMELVPVVQEATRLLILDAVAGPVPGGVVHLTGDQIPRMLAAKLSPHQVGLLDVLSAVRLLGHEPDRLEVVGVVPESVDLRIGLSASVADALPDAVALAAGILDRWLAEVGQP